MRKKFRGKKHLSLTQEEEHLLWKDSYGGLLGIPPLALSHSRDTGYEKKVSLHLGKGTLSGKNLIFNLKSTC